MKMFGVVATVMMMASLALADIQFGTFKGMDEKGAACEIEIIAKYYADNSPHPLNERVTVKFEGSNWDLAHPAVISEKDSRVRFDHSFFSQVVATTTDIGAQTLIVSIDHDNEPHAAKAFTFINDNYRDSSKTRKVVCAGLKEVKK